jgi:hypothetical protein
MTSNAASEIHWIDGLFKHVWTCSLVVLMWMYRRMEHLSPSWSESDSISATNNRCVSNFWSDIEFYQAHIRAGESVCKWYKSCQTTGSISFRTLRVLHSLHREILQHRITSVTSLTGAFSSWKFVLTCDTQGDFILYHSLWYWIK